MSGSKIALAPVRLVLFKLGGASQALFLIGRDALNFDFSEIYFLQPTRVNMDFLKAI